MFTKASTAIIFIRQPYSHKYWVEQTIENFINYQLHQNMFYIIGLNRIFVGNFSIDVKDVRLRI
jgi:hypothetical protein